MSEGFKEICDLIAMGELDDNLNNLVEAVNLRRKSINLLKESANRSIPIGTKVRLVNIRPKYLNGCAGTITRISAGKVSVKLLDRWAVMKAGRFVDMDGTITGPLSCVEVII